MNTENIKEELKIINTAAAFKDAMNIYKERALKAEAKLEKMELVIVCATDIVEFWPKLTMRMFGQMTKQMDTLKQAIQEFKNG